MLGGYDLGRSYGPSQRTGEYGDDRLIPEEGRQPSRLLLSGIIQFDVAIASLNKSVLVPVSFAMSDQNELQKDSLDSPASADVHHHELVL